MIGLGAKVSIISEFVFREHFSKHQLVIPASSSSAITTRKSRCSVWLTYRYGIKSSSLIIFLSMLLHVEQSLWELISSTTLDLRLHVMIYQFNPLKSLQSILRRFGNSVKSLVISIALMSTPPLNLCHKGCGAYPYRYVEKFKGTSPPGLNWSLSLKTLIIRHGFKSRGCPTGF